MLTLPYQRETGETMRRLAWVGLTLLALGCVEENEDAMLDSGVGSCVPGRALECACPGGTMGTQACGEDLTFGPCVCGDMVECEPGDVEREECDDGTRSRRCSNDGQWAEWSSCEGACDADTEQMRPCGKNDRGEQARACVDGAWEAWSDCDDPDVCVDGEGENEDCGEDGTRSRACEDGGWSSWTLCEEANPDCPEEGAEQRQECGLNGRGMKSRVCSDGAWGDWSECADDDECRDDAEMSEPCGDNGQRARTCNRGQWGNWTACMEDRDPDPPAGCPIASVQNPRRQAEPLDTLSLTPGRRSMDAVAWRWIVVDRPEGSTAALVEPGAGGRDNVGTPDAEFFLDLAGRYVFELQVEGESGKIAPSDACPQDPAQITVDVVSQQDILVQLTWNTPLDGDQTDGDGSDVDIHLQHPNGRGWSIAPLDCYWSNPTPDWGRAGDESDDPSLDIDDTNGAGPENISLSRPEDTGGGPGYSIGVDYYRSDDFIGARDWGPSVATVRVFLGGELAEEYERELQRTGNFWEVAKLEWEDREGRLVEVNRFFANGP